MIALQIAALLLLLLGSSLLAWALFKMERRENSGRVSDGWVQRRRAEDLREE